MKISSLATVRSIATITIVFLGPTCILAQGTRGGVKNMSINVDLHANSRELLVDQTDVIQDKLDNCLEQNPDSRFTSYSFQKRPNKCKYWAMDENNKVSCDEYELPLPEKCRREIRFTGTPFTNTNDFYEKIEDVFKFKNIDTSLEEF